MPTSSCLTENMGEWDLLKFLMLPLRYFQLVNGMFITRGRCSGLTGVCQGV